MHKRIYGRDKRHLGLARRGPDILSMRARMARLSRLGGLAFLLLIRRASIHARKLLMHQDGGRSLQSSGDGRSSAMDTDNDPKKAESITSVQTRSVSVESDEHRSVFLLREGRNIPGVAASHAMHERGEMGDDDRASGKCSAATWDD
jgi:hypothetical protein